ncbi:class I SAM-dependent methyltransferase [Fundidesulfovibrio terrae]|uniref:class I SAM-dependent methyltransferase n=1 Tax=Fundidesulfovibrio terrae TaxID=2922866 RepID=UPI001FB02316|nr:class I SAM-dependent methyltransferase [Fundidesulfovibrio terrae]
MACDPGSRMEELDSQALQYERCGFWQHYVHKSGTIIAPRVAGKRVLEMGCSTMVISPLLFSAARELEIVEGSSIFSRQARERFGDDVLVHNSMFEEFTPGSPYEAVVLANTMHHLADPEMVLRRLKSWLVPGGSLHLTVPNMLSLHRRMGVLMGLIPDISGVSERNRMFMQSGRYTKESLTAILTGCGYTVRESFCFFLKPFSDEQMEALNPTQDMVDALFELGKLFPELASLIYVEASPSAP